MWEIWPSSVIIHISHVNIHAIISSLPDDGSCLFGCHLSDLNLPFNVTSDVRKLRSLILLLNELDRIRHVVNLTLQSDLLLVVVLNKHDLLLGLLNRILSLNLVLLLDLHLRLIHVLDAHSVLKFLFQAVQGLDGFARVKLKS